MGDALHTMGPFKGASANTALLDAVDIFQLVVQSQERGKDMFAILEPYEQMAIPQGRGMMQMSRGAGLSPDPMQWTTMMKKVFDAGYHWQMLAPML